MSSAAAEGALRVLNDDPLYRNWAKVGHAVNVTLVAVRPLVQRTMEQLQQRSFHPADGELAHLDPPLPPACDCGQQYDSNKKAAVLISTARPFPQTRPRTNLESEL